MSVVVSVPRAIITLFPHQCSIRRCILCGVVVSVSIRIHGIPGDRHIFQKRPLLWQGQRRPSWRGRYIFAPKPESPVHWQTRQGIGRGRRGSGTWFSWKMWCEFLEVTEPSASRVSNASLIKGNERITHSAQCGVRNSDGAPRYGWCFKMLL